MNVTLKRSDDGYTFNYTVVEDDGTIVNLIGATAKFRMGNRNKIIFTNPATVIDAVNGIVSYTFAGADTIYDGGFVGEFEITFSNGAVLSYPRTGYLSVIIQANVDMDLPNITLDDIAEKQGDFQSKLDSILQQAGNITVSAVNDYTWTATNGQLTYVMPSNANYNPNTNWFDVFVGGARIDSSLVDRTISNQFTLRLDPSIIQDGMSVYARWTEPVIPITNGHHGTHELGGQDVIDVTKLLNYNEMISSPLADIAYNVKNKGAKCDFVTDDTSSLQSAIDFVSGLGGGKVIIPANIYCAGTIILKNGVYLEGIGKITFKTGATIAITTPTPTLVPLTQTTDILKGDKTNNITNTLNVGDFITYRSSARFTEDWDNGTAIRSYYTKGEIHKIVSVTTSQVTFAEPSSFDLPVSLSTQVEAFTPTKNVGIKNIWVTRTYDDTTTSDAILIQYCDGAEIENVYTENSNRYGIGLSKSRNISIHNWSGKGGSHALGLNYGIANVDGCKHVKVNKVSGQHFRHVVTTGTSGYAVSIGAVVDTIFASDNDSNNPSLDCHGCSMNITYRNAWVDNGLDISGSGHNVENVHSLKGTFMLSEGGKNTTFRNIRIIKGSRFQLAKSSKNIRFEDIEIHLTGAGKYTYHASPDLQYGDSLFYKNVKIVNDDALTGMTAAQLDSTVNSNCLYGFSVWSPNSTLENVWIEGFPIAIQLGAENIKVKGLHVRNCGWKGSIVAFPIVVGIYLDSVNLSIDNVTYGWYLTALPSGSGYRFMQADGSYIRTPAPSTCKGITIRNFRYTSNHQKNFYSNDIVFTSAYTNFLIDAFEVPSAVSIATGTGGVTTNQWNG
jgi:hypothetical protein